MADGVIGSVGVSVVPDATDFWRRFKAQTEGNEPTIDVRVRADTTAAAAEIARLRAQLAGASGDVRVRVHETGAREATQNVSLLRDAIILLGPAAIPIAGVLSGALAGAVPVVATLAAGLLGIKEQFKSGALQASTYGGNITELKSEFQTLKATAAAGLLDGFSHAMNGLRTQFPEVNANIATMSSQLGQIGANVLPAFVHLMNDLNPLFVTLGQSLLHGAQAFQHWVNTSSGVSNFVAYAQAELPVVAHALSELAQAAGHLVVGLAPLGHTVLLGITLFSQAINAIPVGVLQALLPVLVGVYATARTYALLVPIIAAVSAAYGFFASIVTASTLATEAAVTAEAAVVAEASAAEAVARSVLAASVAEDAAVIAGSLIGEGTIAETVAAAIATASAEEAAAFQLAADAAIASAAEISAAAEAAATASAEAGAAVRAGWLAALGPLAAVAIGVGLLAVVMGTSGRNTQEAAKAANTYAQSVRDSTDALSAANIAQTNDNLAKSGALGMYDKLGSAAQKLGLTQADLTSAVNGSDEQFKNVIGTLDKYLSQINDERNSGKLTTDMVDQGHAAIDLKDKLKTLREGLHQQILTQTELNTLNEASIGITDRQAVTAASLYNLHGTSGVAAYLAAQKAADKNTASTKAQTLAFQLENDAASLVNQALQTMAGQNLSIAQAKTADAQATMTLTDSLKTNGATIASNTKEGLANQQALEGKAASLRSVLTAEASGTTGTKKATAEYHRNADALLAQIAQQYGAKSAIYAYAQEILKIPKVHLTKIDLQKEAAEKLRAEWVAAVARIPHSATTQIRVSGDAQQKLNGILTTLRTIGQGANSEVHITTRNLVTHETRTVVARAYGGTIEGYAGGGTPGQSGTVFGPGTSKSDSIWARLSVGEEVIQQPYAGQNRALLKAINAGHGPMTAAPASAATPNVNGPVKITGRLVVDDQGRGELVDAFLNLGTALAY